VNKTLQGIPAFIGLGSNLGERLDYLCESVRRLATIPGITLVDVAGVYQTEPIGITDQPDFLNSVVQVQTYLAPIELLQSLQAIEKQLGRKRAARWSSRTIDLDLLSVDALVLNDPLLSLPHPRLGRRRFALVPFAEIAPSYVVPGLQQTIGQLLSGCRDNQRVDRRLTSSEFRQRIQTP
jgi:2-amino-4-hydroxy-6-hydroxymethyldihydropteridine diphosphokinase